MTNNKNGIKVLSVIAMLLGVIIFSTGCTESLSGKTYKKDDFSITMDKGFIEKDYMTLTYYFESQSSMVSALKEYISDLEQVEITKDTSIEEYLEFILMVNEFDDSEVKTDENSNMKYIEYNKSISGKDFYYLAVAVKGEDAFWLCNFACEEKNQSKYKDKFIEWAETIEVK